MFCEKCGNKLKEGAKFCEECGAAIEMKEVLNQKKENVTERSKSAGRKIVIITVIALIVIVSVVIIVLVKRNGKENMPSESVEPTTSVGTEMADFDVTSELPALTPDSEEEYEAFFDKLEFLTLGDEPADDSESSEGNFETEDIGDITDNSEEMASTEEIGAAVASALSTTDYAKAMDFEWLHDVTESDGSGAGIVLDESLADAIPVDDNSYLNGGWKAYMYGTDADYGERYMNAEIETQDGKISITVNWKYYCLAGNSYEEDGNSEFSGQRNLTDGVITADSSSGKLELSEFYISKDKEHEYARGAFLYPSGELYIFGLMR